MLKSLRTTLFFLLLTAQFAAPAWPQATAKPQESPWAMRAPAAIPQGAPTISAAQQAAIKQAAKGTPEQREFARKVANAMSLKDYAALKMLISPATLKCIGKNQDYLEDRMKKQFDLPISKDFKPTFTQLPTKMIHETKYATYPMLPSHLMGMEFTTADGSTATVNLVIGQEDGKWYEAQPCPTAAGMERFAKNQKMQKAQHERAKAAAAQVKDPVKSQLIALVGQRDNVGAWKLCMSSLKLDFPTCKGIVSILSGDESY
jgi:hypothetical protein